MAYLVAKNICKSYKRSEVLKDVSFAINRGDVMAIAGANGAGKTTLLKILSLVSRPDSGTLEIDGEDAVKNAPAIRTFISYVPQQSAVLDELTVRDNLKYWLKRGNKDALMPTVNALGLEDYLDTRALALSGGYLRRLNLAIAQINRPRLLIMDEPLTGVDIDTRLKFSSWIRSLKEEGVCVIYTTHHTDEIERVADCMGIVYRGGMKFIRDIEGLYLDNLISRFINLA